MKRIRESEYFKIDVITTLLCLLPILIGVSVYGKLPDQMPIHFDGNGNVNGYAGKAFAVFGLPALLVGVQILVCVFTEIDPKKKNASKPLQIIGRLIIPVTSTLVQIITILCGLGKEFNMMLILNLFMGFLFLIIGNLLPKCKYNYTVGIRIPTTLASEENWNKTHRFAGFVWVIGSIGMIVSAFFSSMVTMVVFLVAMTAIPMVYSLVYAIRAKERQ